MCKQHCFVNFNRISICFFEMFSAFLDRRALFRDKIAGLFLEQAVGVKLDNAFISNLE